MPHAEIRHLSRAPITEAVIDVRVRLAVGAQVNSLAALPSALARRYPAREEQRVLRGELRLDVGQIASGQAAINGYRFTSESRTDVVQLRLDGFTFSRLHPYTSWEEVLGEARLLWDHYATVAPVEALMRLAVRYINNFVIPAGRSASEYLTSRPKSPEGLRGTSIRASLSRLLLHRKQNRVQHRAHDLRHMGVGSGVRTNCSRDS